jgi:hypothetical protein
MIDQIDDRDHGVRCVFGSDESVPDWQTLPIKLVLKRQETLCQLVRRKELSISSKPIHPVHLVLDCVVDRFDNLNHIDGVFIHKPLYK